MVETMTEALSLSVQHVMLSPDSSQLTLKIFQTESVISVKDIVRLLQNPALPRYKLNIDGVNKAIAAFTMLRERLGESEQEKSIDFPPIAIANKVDAILHIDIDNDKMSAYARITVAYGGKSITLEDIKKRCEQLDIKFGLSTLYIIQLLDICRHSYPGRIYTLKIAKGLPPVDGTDAEFKQLVSTDNHRKPAPTILPNGKVDMLNLGEFITVDVGAVLMQKTPVYLGEPGKTVTSETVQQQQGIDHPFIINDNVQINPGDPLQLIATKYGVPIEKQGFISIDDVLLLEEVTNKTGHVDYNGTVVITGDVEKGMKVNVRGDVTVMGTVDSAHITCGGDLTVQQAVIGYQKKTEEEQFSCEINCQGNFTGTIAQYARLKIGKDLLLSSQLIHCDTECDGSIKVHNKSLTKGSIIGGLTKVKSNIITAIIGTSGGTKTVIELKGDVSNLEKKKDVQIHDLHLVNSILDKFKQADYKADAILNIADRRKAKRQIMLEKQQYRDASDRIQNEMAITKSYIEASYNCSFITATKKLFSDTTVSFGHQTWCSNEEYGPSTVSLFDKKLRISPYEAS